MSYFTKKQRHAIRMAFRKQGIDRVDRLAARAYLKFRIDHYQQDRRLAVIVDSTDCDHTQLVEAKFIPASVMAFKRLERRIMDSAEGPTYLGLEYPHAAMEQFSNGPLFRDWAAEDAGY